MNRLFVVGCSFTKYHWPTWADMLGKEYDHFENWGNSGLGNRAIAERLTELVVTNNITQDDTIIVQWTDFHRFDVHSNKHQPITGWNCGGSVLLNPQYYPTSWVENYWQEESFMMHTFNFIKMATALLETLPCKWQMFTMNDLVEPINQFPKLEKYKSIFSTDNWSPSLNNFFLNGYPVFTCKNEEWALETSELVDYVDPHPTPEAHYNYACTYLAPKLNITVNTDWANFAQDLLKNTVFHSHLKDKYSKSLDWTPDKYWVRGI